MRLTSVGAARASSRSVLAMYNNVRRTRIVCKYDLPVGGMLSPIMEAGTGSIGSVSRPLPTVIIDLPWVGHASSGARGAPRRRRCAACRSGPMMLGSTVLAAPTAWVAVTGPVLARGQQLEGRSGWPTNGGDLLTAMAAMAGTKAARLRPDPVQGSGRRYYRTRGAAVLPGLQLRPVLVEVGGSWRGGDHGKYGACLAATFIFCVARHGSPSRHRGGSRCDRAGIHRLGVQPILDR